MESRRTSSPVGTNYFKGKLCHACNGITEYHTRFNFDNDSDRRVYAHHPHLSALENPAINGYIICQYVFEGFKAVPGVEEPDIRLTIALSSEPRNHHPRNGPSEREITESERPCSVHLEERETLDGAERFESCAPVRYRVRGTLADGTARIYTIYFPPRTANFKVLSSSAEVRAIRFVNWTSFSLGGPLIRFCRKTCEPLSRFLRLTVSLALVVTYLR